jgi:hypothetical protein
MLSKYIFLNQKIKKEIPEVFDTYTKKVEIRSLIRPGSERRYRKRGPNPPS